MKTKIQNRTIIALAFLIVGILFCMLFSTTQSDIAYAGSDRSIRI